MSEMTKRQAEAWSGAVADVRRISESMPEDFRRWDVTWREEVRPGRGQAISAVYSDGEHFAQITMDVYGYPSTSIAEISWVHASDDEDCDCGCNRPADESGLNS